MPILTSLCRERGLCPGSTLFRRLDYFRLVSNLNSFAERSRWHTRWPPMMPPVAAWYHFGLGLLYSLSHSWAVRDALYCPVLMWANGNSGRATDTMQLSLTCQSIPSKK